MDSSVASTIWRGRAYWTQCFSEPNGITSVLSADDTAHSRQRRLLAHAFSDKALREQEPLLHGYVDLLISKLHEESHARDGVVDLVDWYRYTTFDIIADLCFGESFGNLENKAEHALSQFVPRDGLLVALLF